MPQSPLVVTLDVGSSSVRSRVFDGTGGQAEGFGDKAEYRVKEGGDGSATLDPDELLSSTVRVLDTICAQLRKAGAKAGAVGMDTFWHSFGGVDAAGQPVTPILHLLDTRSAEAAARLASRVDAEAVRARTGCVLHPSYYPAKLLWLSESQPEVFARVQRWMSFGEYLFLKLFGKAAASTSMMSASGLWNQNANDYDQEMLGALPVRLDQFPAKADLDAPCSELEGEFAQRWPELNGIPWFPALGDGACNNAGSGCVAKDRFSAMVGTTGAMRAIARQDSIEIPKGIWCYRVDPQRFVLGGALSDGGSVYAWISARLKLPAPHELELQLESAEPGTHGLTVLPLFAGERSTGWRADARAAMIGLSSSTSAVDIARAALESVALRFRDIYNLMSTSLGEPREVIASGGGLLHSAAWTQMTADALGRRVAACIEDEATSRGAALLALERIGAIRDIADAPPRLGSTFEPVREHRDVYQALLHRQQRLYQKLFEEAW